MPDVRPRIRAVLFDVGGTLVYEPDLAGWREPARRLHLAIDPDQLERAYVEVLTETASEPRDRNRGAAVVDFWRRTFSRATGKDVSESTAVKIVAARKKNSAPVRLYSDARPCLNRLRQDRRSLGIISNSTSEAVVRLVLDRAGVLGYFDRIVSSGTEGVEKPDPEIFLRAVRGLDLRPAEALYVGNLALTDAKAAHSAGLYGVWLNREGLSFGESLPQITSLLEIPQCIRRIEQGLPVN
jgi:FMN phosphatase YigB (HAD superfamily)